MNTNFGQLLQLKRREAGLAPEELAEMSRLPLARLTELEQGLGEQPTFDTCYRLSAALTAHSDKRFILQDLWSALKMDRYGATPENGAGVAAGEEPA